MAARAVAAQARLAWAIGRTTRAPQWTIGWFDAGRYLTATPVIDVPVSFTMKSWVTRTASAPSSHALLDSVLEILRGSE